MVLLKIMCRFLPWLFLQEMKHHTDSGAGAIIWVPYEKSHEGKTVNKSKASREKGNGAEKVERKVVLFMMLPSH